MDREEALKPIQDWEDAREKQLGLHLAFQSHDHGPKRDDPMFYGYWGTYEEIAALEIGPHIKLLKSVIMLGAIEAILDNMPLVQQNLADIIKNCDEVEQQLNLLISKYGPSSSGRTIN